MARDTVYGDPYSISVTHLGNAKGRVKIDFRDDGDLHRVTVPYSFPGSPNGPQLRFEWGNFQFESDTLDTPSGLPDEIKELVKDQSGDARRKANY